MKDEGGFIQDHYDIIFKMSLVRHQRIKIIAKVHVKFREIKQKFAKNIIFKIFRLDSKLDKYILISSFV